jgi:hypothetical protein
MGFPFFCTSPIPDRRIVFAKTAWADLFPQQVIRLAMPGKLRKNREARDDVSRTGFKQPLAI